MKNNLKKRLLACALSVLTVLGCMPGFPMTVAYAATVPVTDEAGLISAISGAGAGDIIGLTQDITLTADLTVSKNVALASAGAKLIAGGYRIIIPSGSSVSFVGQLGITGNSATGYNDGLVVVKGSLTLWADQVDISNSYTGGGNSNAIYVEGGALDIQGGSISDTAASASNTSCGVYLNGGSVALDTGGSAISVSGSGSGLSARNGADIAMYAGSVSGNTGVSFNGTNGGSFSMSGGSVAGAGVGVSITGAAAGSVVTGGTITGTSSYGIQADESTLGISGGVITGNSGSGGVYSQGGSTINVYRNSGLSITNGIRTANGYVGGTTFLTALPAAVSLPVDTDGSVSLSLGSTTFALDAVQTAASLGASYSDGTISLHPTAAAANLPLVLTTSVTWNDSDDDLTETLKLTLPVTVTEKMITAPAVITGAISNLTAISVTVAGAVTSDGGEAPTVYGVVYSTAENPTTTSSAVTGSSTAAGFTTALSGLSPNTIYHARAYAVNTGGTSYGDDVSFMTLSNSGAMVPTVSTGNRVIGADAGLAANQLYAYGNVTKQGFSEVTERGILYYVGDTSPAAVNFVVSANPNHDTNIVQVPASAGGGGEYRIMITNSSSNTKYWFRAYAVNSDGTSYGSIEYTSLHGTTIHISTEEGGSIASAGGAVVNQNGTLFWNGTSWVTNDTAAHMYFISLLTAERITPISNIAITGSGIHSYTSSMGNNVSITVEVQNYSYSTAAISSGSYTYSGHEYRITAVYTDSSAGTTQTDTIVLRSKGVGSGTGNTYFDGFIQISGSGDITALRSDPNWITYTGMTMAQALEAAETIGTLNGRFITTNANYYMDVGGGADMGGRSYIYRTGSFSNVYTSDTSALYSKSFTLRCNGGAEIINLNFTPELLSETYTPGFSGDSDKKSSGSSGDSTYIADVREGSVKTGTLPVTVDSAKTGKASLSATKAAALLKDDAKAAVVMPTISGVSTYTLELPASVLSGDQKNGALTLSTGVGSVTFPRNMLSSLTGADGKTMGITIADGDKTGLTDAEKAAVGNRPIIKLTLSLDGTKTSWSNPNAPVTVTIPYTPTATELKNSDSIVIWYLDSIGKPVCVPNGHYDAVTGAVTFTATHFSQYAVGYNAVSFNDVVAGAWYHDAVSFIAARGITTGTGNDKYSPESTLTRGQFIVMLMRAYDISHDANPTDNFSDAGSTYYTNYLAAAKRLGIAKGVGDNKFAPEQAITRQEMFTLLYNALKALNQLPEETSGKALSDFTDSTDIATWAKDAMTALVKAGTIAGSGGKLSPTATTTRAEMAQVLYSLLGK